MPVMKRSTHYNMNHSRRGTALVFNHENFTVPDLKSRAGTQTDAQSFSDCLRNLGFDVEVYNDLNYKDLSRVIENSRYSYKFIFYLLLIVLVVKMIIIN